MNFTRGTGRAVALTAALTAAALAAGPATAAAPRGSGSVSASPAPGARGSSVAPAGARGNDERLWLLGGLVAALTGTGLVARAALRDRPGP